MILAVLAVAYWPMTAITQEAEPTDDPAAEQRNVTYEMAAGTVWQVEGDDRVQMDLPAPAVAILFRTDKLYVAFGHSGAAVYDVSDPDKPVPVKQVHPPGEQVTGFFVVDNQVWMRIVSTSAKPIAVGEILVEPGPAPVAADAVTMAAFETNTEKKPPSIEMTPHIIGLFPGEVKLDVGEKHGVKVGDRFSVFRTIEMETHGEDRFTGREFAAVIEVTAVSEDRAIAMLWRGDRVSTADEVQPVYPDHSVSKAFPRRLSDIAEVSAVIRPILNLDGDLGLAGLGDLSGIYYGSAYFVGVRVQPIGFLVTGTEKMFGLNATAEGGYDGRAFALGAGVGVAFATGKQDPGYETDGGFVLSQIIRLGVADGLNLTARNAFVNFEWGSVQGKLDIPLTGRTDLFIEGGGGEFVGNSLGALGVFTWLKGNGDAGSIGLSVSTGFAAVWHDVGDEDEDETDIDDEPLNGDGEEDEDQNVMAIGPMVSVGLDYRFGF
ncbi:MAG: FlgT C-terminal domain-containing protein [Myxococcota bacterium]|nr:FlgT C-terminal domain-containing protein [Myxococcota bacterium]